MLIEGVGKGVGGNGCGVIIARLGGGVRVVVLGPGRKGGIETDRLG